MSAIARCPSCGSSLELVPEAPTPLNGFILNETRDGVVPDPNYRTRFTVGQRILPLNALYRYYPRATVTEITAKGFRYRYDEKIVLGTRHGWYQEGESYTDDGWELAADQTPFTQTVDVPHE